MKIREFIIMPHTADSMGLIHKPGTGPNNRFDFKNKGNNKANEKAPPGREKQVKALKKKFGKSGAYALAWAQHNKHGKPKKEAEEQMDKVDLKLPTGQKMVLQADDNEHTRGLVIKSNEDGSYDSYYWYNNPKEAMPIEVKIDGESVSKDAKNVRWEYHPELEEEAAGVGIVTKQNATKDVPVGGEYMNIKKLGLGSGKPKTMREEFAEYMENFADGKKKGKSRPGRVKRAGASCKGSVTSLRSKAKKASGERAKMYHWCANMKSGRKKK